MSLKKEDVDKLTEKIIKETGEMEGVLQFIQDWGSYKDREKYRLSDYEYKMKIKQFKNGIILLQTNIVVAEHIIQQSKSTHKKFDDTMADVVAEIKKQILEKRDKETTNILH